MGPATGETIACATCQGKVEIKVFDCAVFGKATLARDVGHHVCQGCARKEVRRKLTVSANGIGDHIIALALAAASPATVVIKPWQRQWVDLFEADVTEAPFPAEEVHRGLQARGSAHWVDVAADLPRALPRPRPVDTTWAEQYRNAVIFSPLSLGSGAGRNWLMSHWLALERLLLARGERVVVICSGGDESRLGTFQTILPGLSAAKVAGLMRVARCVVSNESGMAHLAGALRVPCVVLAAQHDGRRIHGLWPETTVIQGPLACSGCKWQGPDFRAACHEVCASLQAITPETVAEAIPAEAGALSAEMRRRLARLNLLLPVPINGRSSFIDRGRTFAAFFRALPAGPLRVVETGCQRQEDDVGAGMSTSLIGQFLAERGDGSRLISLDLDEAHRALARRVCPSAEVVHTDSRVWLRENREPIDGLYLDSCDTWVPEYQDVCLEEAQLAALAPGAVVLIDDTWATGDGWAGKGGKAVPWLIGEGWRVEANGYQVMLRRAP